MSSMVDTGFTTPEPNLKRSDKMKCVICDGEIKPLLHPDTGVVVWEQGNNAEPVASGRCCDVCNRRIVVPARFMVPDVDDSLNEVSMGRFDDDPPEW